MRLASFVPPAIREEIERSLGGAVAGTGFRQAALAAVSGAAAVRWAQEMSVCVPALGIPAGPACLARLWVAGLLREERALAACWTSVVDEVWNVVCPALERMDVASRGRQREDLRHEIAAPLALVFLKSVAAGRKDLRLVCDGGGSRPDGPPFGWAPGIDALRPLLRYLLLGQVPHGFQSHAFLSSALARLARSTGLVVPVLVTRRHCPSCGLRPEGSAGACPQCGGDLVTHRCRRLVARAVLEQRAVSGPPWSGRGQESEGGEGPTGQPPVPEGVECGWVRRRCVVQAHRLWDRVTRGREYGVAAVVVLGALAGVRPLEAIGNRPAPRREWLDGLVESLAGGRLARGLLARQANAARAAVARGLGRPEAPPILAAYVGVLATRFRKAVFGPLAREGARAECGLTRGVANGSPADTMHR